MVEQDNKYSPSGGADYNVAVPLPDGYQDHMRYNDSDLVLDIPFPEVIALEEEMDHIYHPEQYDEMAGLSFGEFEQILAREFDIATLLSPGERIAAFLRYQEWHEEIEEAVHERKNGQEACSG